MSNRRADKTEVLQGTLDLMVLQTIEVLGPSHGYAIVARVEQVSKGAIQLNMGTLYPALMRLEQRGLLRGAWGVSDTGLRKAAARPASTASPRPASGSWPPRSRRGTG